jgi:hypothetical protein
VDLGKRICHECHSLCLDAARATSGGVTQDNRDAATHNVASGAALAIELRQARAAVATDPDSIDARRRLAKALLDRKEFQLARNVVEGAIKRGLDDASLDRLATRIDLLQSAAAAVTMTGAEPEPLALGGAAICAPTPTAADTAAADGDSETDRPPRYLFDSGKLLATSGVSEVEGAAGGGLAAWALIAGYESEDGIGVDAHYTYVGLPDYTLNSAGAAVGFYDRLELSFTRERFDTAATGKALGLGQGFTFQEDIVGAKVRVLGHAVYDQDTWVPQVSVGAQYKNNNQPAVIAAVGGRSSEGVDIYLAASKLFLAESLLVNGTVRATKANQFGILGFGGDRSNSYQPEFEGGAALLLSRQLAIGSEFRTKPDNLRFAHEDDAYDFFIAWFPIKNLSLTLAYASLGDIATRQDQDGAFLSIQAGF